MGMQKLMGTKTHQPPIYRLQWCQALIGARCGETSCPLQPRREVAYRLPEARIELRISCLEKSE